MKGRQKKWKVAREGGGGRIIRESLRVCINVSKISPAPAGLRAQRLINQSQVMTYLEERYGISESVACHEEICVSSIVKIGGNFQAQIPSPRDDYKWITAKANAFNYRRERKEISEIRVANYYADKLQPATSRLTCVTFFFNSTDPRKRETFFVARIKL